MASAWLLSRLTMTIEPLRMVNRAPTSFGTLSTSCEGKGIVPFVMGSPTLIGGVADPFDGAGLMYSRTSRISSGDKVSGAGADLSGAGWLLAGVGAAAVSVSTFFLTCCSGLAVWLLADMSLFS